jgi:hypothetical protein
MGKNGQQVAIIHALAQTTPKCFAAQRDREAAKKAELNVALAENELFEQN